MPSTSSTISKATARPPAPNSASPPKPSKKWTAAEDDLRADYSDYQRRRFDRLLPELHLTMLDRAVAVVNCLDDTKLAEASASQLAYVLNILGNHIVKMEEIARANDPAPPPDKVKMELPPRTPYADDLLSVLGNRYTNFPMPAPAAPYADDIAPLPATPPKSEIAPLPVAPDVDDIAPLPATPPNNEIAAPPAAPDEDDTAPLPATPPKSEIAPAPATRHDRETKSLQASRLRTALQPFGYVQSSPAPATLLPLLAAPANQKRKKRPGLTPRKRQPKKRRQRKRKRR